jgi:hypothetical protein
MEKAHYLCEQARVFGCSLLPSDAAVTVCIHRFLMVQKIEEKSPFAFQSAVNFVYAHSFSVLSPAMKRGFITQPSIKDNIDEMETSHFAQKRSSRSCSLQEMCCSWYIWMYRAFFSLTFWTFGDSEFLPQLYNIAVPQGSHHDEIACHCQRNGSFSITVPTLYNS